MQQQHTAESSNTSDDDIPELVHMPLTGWKGSFVFPVAPGLSATNSQVDVSPAYGIYDGLYMLCLASLSDRTQSQQQTQPEQSRP